MSARWEALRAKAQAATRGEWHVGCGSNQLIHAGDRWIACTMGTKGAQGAANAAYIAAASPDAVLALLAERDALLAALESVIDSASPLIDDSGPGHWPVSRGQFCVEGHAIDEARAVLAQATGGAP